MPSSDISDSGTPDPDPSDAAPDPAAVESRANLLPEEEAAGSDDPRQQAEVILEESAERILASDTDPEPTDGSVERRTSADTVAPPDLV